jgi:CMP-N-acetylneuraminic acid synthetase
MVEETEIYALSTARAGSKSVPEKNLLDICGKPLYLHNILASMKNSQIKGTYLSTDIPRAIELADKYGYQIIRRPAELCQDHSTHDDTIRHGLLEIEKRIGHQLDILVVMLGNTMNVNEEDLNAGLAQLKKSPDADSVVTVIQANHFNPMRAYVANGKGQELTTFLAQDHIKQLTSKIDLSDKNSIGTIYFQNGLWFLRRRAVMDAGGMLPFQWFGNKVEYLVQDPSLQEVDAAYQIKLLPGQH